MLNDGSGARRRVVPPNRAAHRRALLVVGALAIEVLLLSGCRQGGRSEAAEEIMRAQDRYWAAWLDASEGQEPDPRTLEAVAGGDQLELLLSNLEASRDAGQYSSGNVERETLEVRVAAQTAVVVECVDLDRWLVHDLATGEVAEHQLLDKPSQHVEFRLELQDGRWLVVDSVELGDCAAR